MWKFSVFLRHAAQPLFSFPKNATHLICFISFWFKEYKFCKPCTKSNAHPSRIKVRVKSVRYPTSQPTEPSDMLCVYMGEDSPMLLNFNFVNFL